MTNTPQAEYERRRAAAVEVEQRLDQWSAAFGHGRVLIVFGAVASALWTYLKGGTVPVNILLWLGLAGIATLIAQGIVDRRRDRALLRVHLYDRALARLRGEWRNFSSKGTRFQDPAHPYAADLDVLGDGSLFQLLDTTHTAQGEEALARWLLAPGELSTVRVRREAAQALATDLDGREALALGGADAELSRIDERPLIQWAEGPLAFNPSPALIWATRILPFVTIGLIYAANQELLTGWLVFPFAAVHFLILRQTRQGVNAVGQVAEKAELILSRLLPLFEAAQQIRPTTPLLKERVEQLGGAVQAVASLKRRVTTFQSRGNVFVALLIPFTFWDIHAAIALESWQRREGKSLRSWFEAIGDLEALSALGTYTAENPADIVPVLVDEGLTFEAKELGHPLIPLDRCVRNNVALPGPGTALLVTGSNMSGKSTLLRAVGINTVMALAGLPVRATSMRVSRVQVATVMRVADSLQQGASFFMAEVRRLKSVVDVAHGPIPELFLLDEILQGTNTRERSLGARGVIAHLLQAGAFGMVSTHDLSLVRLEDAFGSRIINAHFTDQVSGDQMTFDYRLKPGVVQSSNALRLMRAVGLKVEVPEHEAASET